MFYLKLIIIIIASNSQIISDRYSHIIEKDGSLSKYMHGPGYKYTEPYTDGILLNGSFFTKDKLNIVGIDEMAPEMDFTGFWGKLSYYLNEGNFNGYKYNLEGKAVGISPNMGMPPAVGVGGIGAVKGGVNALQQFNSVESIIVNAGKLQRLKGGIKQGVIQGNVDDIFKGLAQQYGAKIQTNGAETFFQSGQIRVGIHGSVRGAGVPTLHINKVGQLYKIRVHG